LNPKVAIFFLAFLPQFAHPDQGYLSWQLCLLGGTFALIAWIIFSMLGLFSSVLGHWIHSRPRLTRMLDYLVGSLFVVLGLSLAFTGRK
jgi:threonine/homoserine/homoserine lactone efflux protein